MLTASVLRMEGMFLGRLLRLLQLDHDFVLGSAVITSLIVIALVVVQLVT
jgi:hypothetical protein